MESLELSKNFWKNKKVLITGHTGFKGSWLSLYLYLKGAKIFGYSLRQKQKFAIYNILKLDKIFVKSQIANINNKSKFLKFFKSSDPDLAIHMAAQPIVIDSYKNPVATYQTNINGTINFLECALKMKKLKSVVVVTSDKCYQNLGINKSKGYSENDKLGGKDPYSSSKACAEIIVNAYRESFFKKKKINLATVRAGNVIGGGDWANYRLFVDLAKYLFLNEKMEIRNINSTRPWQHVLESVSGYSLLLEKLYINKKFSSAWNFGPKTTDCLSVEKILSLLSKKNKKIKNITLKKKVIFEEQKLQLDITKSKNELRWKPKTNINIAIELTLDWYEFFFKNFKNKSAVYDFTLKQINNFNKIN